MTELMTHTNIRTTSTRGNWSLNSHQCHHHCSSCSLLLLLLLLLLLSPPGLGGGRSAQQEGSSRSHDESLAWQWEGVTSVWSSHGHFLPNRNVRAYPEPWSLKLVSLSKLMDSSKGFFGFFCSPVGFRIRRPESENDQQTINKMCRSISIIWCVVRVQ